MPISNSRGRRNEIKRSTRKQSISSETIISEYMKTQDYIDSSDKWKKYVKENSIGIRSIYLSGYITGMGYFKT